MQLRFRGAGSRLQAISGFKVSKGVTLGREYEQAGGQVFYICKYS